MTGQCDKGCDAGWTGGFCDQGNVFFVVCTNFFFCLLFFVCSDIDVLEFHYIHVMVIECMDGTYGYDCINLCSGQCRDDFPCNKQTGHCVAGCNPGFAYANCSKGLFRRCL